MNYLSAESVSKSYNDKWLVNEITVGISQGEKFALVGANGAGKTTLLRMLAGVIEPDKGLVSVRDGIRLGYLDQQSDEDPTKSVKDILFDTSNPVSALVQRYEHLMEHPESSDDLHDVLEQMDTLKAWDYEAKVKEIISRLGVPDLEKPFGELSGGQRKRVFLAQLLLSEPDLLLLDEPTNHLDLEAIEWLENYLTGQLITLIMVTHDRYFLDNVATEILELDKGRLHRYKGNYAYYVEQKAAREAQLTVEVEKARNLLKKELEWMRRQPKARGTKAKYRIDAFHDLKEKASQDLKKDTLELDIKQSRQGGKVLEVEHVGKSYGDKLLVHDFSYVFRKHERIGIVGANGIGKSTFLDMLTGKIKPDTGEIIAGVTTKIGYFTQTASNLNPAHRVIEEVRAIAEFVTLSDGSQVSASRFLESFLFSSDKQYTFIDKLSGGEKKRLQLLKLLITNPNFLILDEPTNDFDIDTLNVLEDFLERFTGCLLLVSHDRYFMDHLVDHLFIFEGEGKVCVYNGNYSDYRIEKQEEEKSKERTESRVGPIEEPSPTPSVRKVSFKEKQEHQQLQQQINVLEAEKEKYVQLLNGGSLNHAELTEWAHKVRQLSESIDEKTMRWLELDELMK